MKAIMRFLLALQYEHITAGIDAMRMDIQGTRHVTSMQHAAMARLCAKRLAVQQRINALRTI